jgi:hypothetical protein
MLPACSVVKCMKCGFCISSYVSIMNGKKRGSLPAYSTALALLNLYQR